MITGANVVAALRAAAGVAALVSEGTSPETFRIYHEDRPQESRLPAVVYTITSRPDELCLDGPAGLQRVAVSIEAIADGTTGARALAAAIRGALGGVTGNFGGATVQAVWCTDETDLSEVEGEEKVRRVLMDFEIL